MIITNAKLPQTEQLVDIYMEDGIIEKITTAGKTNRDNTLDADGRLVLPPFVDPHIHLDSTLTAGQPKWNKSGTLFEGIERWSERRQLLTKKDVKERAKRALEMEISYGVQHVRTHVDTTDPELTGLHALLELKEELASCIDLQLVAFPQEGILSSEQGQDLLEEALRLGADGVGGIPHFEYTREYGVESVKIAFQLAEKYDRFVDIHCDETDDEQSRFIEVVAAEALRTGLGKRVTASHTTAMHSYNNAYTAKLFKLLEKADMNIIANPLINIHLQGRFDSYPKRRGITRVKELMESGINVAFGHDNIFDPWYPLGTGNMLQVLHMGVHICQLLGYDEISKSFDLITTNSARTLNIEDNYGITEGKPANLIILDAGDEFETLRRQAAVVYSIRRGEIISETTPSKSSIILRKEDESSSH
ncbi:cytosine deaminase [Bacillus piscicola]|uniref:cytosine deaminase n=1 Tax=Bacillus piscicola TaxID=1632684 RepID=UPI001F09059A|nr:cytosine deaminase [Bacillus piscicola]